MKALFAFNTDVPWSRVVADQRRWLLPVGAILAINIIVLFAVVLPMRRSVETVLSRRTHRPGSQSRDCRAEGC